MKKPIIILSVVVFILLTSSVNANINRSTAKEKLKNETLLVRVIGEIVDENNKSLTDVDVNIMQRLRSYYVPDEQFKLKTSKFEIDSRIPCNYIRIYFNKYNYTSANISIKPTSSTERPIAWDGDTMIVDVGKVEMKHISNFNEQVSSCKIKGQFSAKLPALEYSISNVYKGIYSDAYTGEMTISTNKEEDIPENTIYCWAERGKGGKIKSVTLKCSSPDSGFIPIEKTPTSDEFLYTTFSKLKESPLDGYRSEIIIPINKREEQYLFYVKQGDLYGKIMLDLNVGYYRKSLEYPTLDNPDGYVNVVDENYTILQDLNKTPNDRKLKSAREH